MAIEHYEFGRITIDGETYTSDVIIWPEGVDASWWRVEGHALCKEDLEPILAKNAEVLIIGTGAHGLMKVPDEIVRYMAGKCDEVHVERTARACEIYNELASSTKLGASGSDRRVVAGLHLAG